MEIVVGSGVGLFCIFYLYVFMKFAGERDTHQILKRRVPHANSSAC